MTEGRGGNKRGEVDIKEGGPRIRGKVKKGGGIKNHGGRNVLWRRLVALKKKRQG